MTINIWKFYKRMSVGCLSLILLSGCVQTEHEELGFANNGGISGEPVDFNIRLVDIPAYNTSGKKASTTRTSEPILAEWVKVDESFNVTRSMKEQDESTGMAAMELFEDTADETPQTRASMSAGVYFRLIAFRKSGPGVDDYQLASAADYQSNGTTASLIKGQMILPMGATYRFVGFSFNNTQSLGDLPASCLWKNTTVTIPNLDNDFMTYDSGDVTISNSSYTLSVAFKQKLCKLRLEIKVSGFEQNTFSNCTGVYIKQGGNASSWKVGAADVEVNTSDSAPFNIKDDTISHSVRLIPFSVDREITVHFRTLTVAGKAVNGKDLTSNKSIKLEAGRSYTMTVIFKNGGPGVSVPEEDIILGKDCTPEDKKKLATLTFAPSNLHVNGRGKVYFENGQWNRGHYFHWNRFYKPDAEGDEGDICGTVSGDGWRTPNFKEMQILSRCVELTNVNFNGVPGRWFLHPSKGIFYPIAGYMFEDRFPYPKNAGIPPSADDPTHRDIAGYYWTAKTSNTVTHALINTGQMVFYDDVTRKRAMSIRCVKGKQIAK